MQNSGGDHHLQTDMSKSKRFTKQSFWSKSFAWVRVCRTWKPVPCNNVNHFSSLYQNSNCSWSCIAQIAAALAAYGTTNHCEAAMFDVRAEHVEQQGQVRSCMFQVKTAGWTDCWDNVADNAHDFKQCFSSYTFAILGVPSLAVRPAPPRSYVPSAVPICEFGFEVSHTSNQTLEVVLLIGGNVWRVPALGTKIYKLCTPSVLHAASSASNPQLYFKIQQLL